MLCTCTAAHAGALTKAQPYLPVLHQALDTVWPQAPVGLASIVCGQVEQESGWNEHATLKTPRELGRGLVQITIAYTPDGRERFNNFRSATRSKYLKDWDWQRDPYNAPYQLTFLSLQDKATFGLVRGFCVDDLQGAKCMLVCYNAGDGRWRSRLRNARLAGLPADRSDGGLDQAYSKGEQALLYGRPLYQAVNEYPRVICKRAIKYQGVSW